MSTTTYPTEITGTEDLRSLLGCKVELEFDYEAKASRHKYARTVTRTARTIGTVELDTRVPSIERYILQRSKHGTVIYPQGQRVLRVIKTAA